MSEPLALTLGQKFELERMSRAIDATVDTQALRGLAKQLLEAWHSQKAATQWVMRQHLDAPPRITPDSLRQAEGVISLNPEGWSGGMDIL